MKVLRTAVAISLLFVLNAQAARRVSFGRHPTGVSLRKRLRWLWFELVRASGLSSGLGATAMFLQGMGVPVHWVPRLLAAEFAALLLLHDPDDALGGVCASLAPVSYA